MLISRNDGGSLLQTYSPYEIGETRIGAQAVESRIHLESGQYPISLLLPFFKPSEGLIFVTQSSINCCD